MTHVDLYFQVIGEAVPLDHGFALSVAAIEKGRISTTSEAFS